MTYFEGIFLRKRGSRRCLMPNRAAMPAWPKSILMIGANVLTARTAMRLRGDASVRTQRAAFRHLIRRLGATSYWREAGIRAGMSYEDFHNRVVPRRYEDLRPAIDRMQHGEADLLWPGLCAFYAVTPGTTLGVPKHLPVTPPMLAHYRTGCRDALLYYTARTGHAGVVGGKHLFLTGSTALKPTENGGRHRAFEGEWAAIAALNLPHWAETEHMVPPMSVAMLADWQAKVEATIASAVPADISLVAGIPPWVLGFAEQLRAKRLESGQSFESLQALWPNLECFLHGGASIAPYQAELRAMFGSTVNFHEVYAGAEGFYAAQDGTTPGELRVMADLGLFFEFIPLADFDESRLETMGEKAFSLAEVKRGVDYVVLLTTPAGLARYIVGDIVRFTSLQPPRLTVVGRTPLLLSAFGENVLTREVTDVLVGVCQRHRWSIVNFHVSPLFGVDLTGQSRGRHEWWIELKPGTVETPTGPQMAVELDIELQRISRSYAERRRSGRIDSPIVRLVMPGVFRHWLRFHGRWGGQNRVARCRSDRLIADELAQITKFARDQL
jgi:hypothetical protein